MLEVLWSLSSPLGDIPRSSARSCGLSPLQLPVLPSHWLWWHISQWQHKLQWSLQNLPRRSHYSPACLLRHGHWWREMDCQYQILSSYFQINVKVFWGVGGVSPCCRIKHVFLCWQTCLFVSTKIPSWISWNPLEWWHLGKNEKLHLMIYVFGISGECRCDQLIMLDKYIAFNVSKH